MIIVKYFSIITLRKKWIMNKKEKITKELKEKGLNDEQISVCLEGYERGYDFNIYAKKEIKSKSMDIFLFWLDMQERSVEWIKKHLDYDYNQLKIINEGLVRGLNIVYYDNKNFSYQKMKAIYHLLKDIQDMKDNLDKVERRMLNNFVWADIKQKDLKGVKK